jgi:hypothetical protein
MVLGGIYKEDRYNAKPHSNRSHGADWQILSSHARPMVLGGIYNEDTYKRDTERNFGGAE